MVWVFQRFNQQKPWKKTKRKIVKVEGRLHQEMGTKRCKLNVNMQTLMNKIP